MFRNQPTQIFCIPYLIIKLLAISQTTCELTPGFNPLTAVFENQTCQQNKCYKFNLETVQGEWQFVVRQVNPSCCKYTGHNITLYSQVKLQDSPYRIAEATTLPPQDYEESYTGPPEINDVTFTVEGFGNSNTSTVPSSTTTEPTNYIPQPSAQKMAVVKKVSSSLARFFKKAACKGDNAIECLARQSMNIIKHQAIAIQNTPPPSTTEKPALVRSPCKINPTTPGCYAWADLTNNIIAPVLDRLEKFKGGYLDKYPSDENSQWSKIGQNLYLQSISQPPANQELSVPAMASMILKQSANTQAEVRMSRIEATQRGWAQQNLSILLFIPSILMFLFYTALNISKFVKFIKKTKTEKQDKKDKKEFSRSQRLKALLEPPQVNPRNRSQATIEMQELV